MGNSIIDRHPLRLVIASFIHVIARKASGLTKQSTCLSLPINLDKRLLQGDLLAAG